MGFEPPPNFDSASLTAGIDDGKASGKNPAIRHYQYALSTNAGRDIVPQSGSRLYHAIKIGGSKSEMRGKAKSLVGDSKIRLADSLRIVSARKEYFHGDLAFQEPEKTAVKDGPLRQARGMNELPRGVFFLDEKAARLHRTCIKPWKQ